jgi:hypothetical protein
VLPVVLPRGPAAASEPAGTPVEPGTDAVVCGATGRHSRGWADPALMPVLVPVLAVAGAELANTPDSSPAAAAVAAARRQRERRRAAGDRDIPIMGGLPGMEGAVEGRRDARRRGHRNSLWLRAW